MAKVSMLLSTRVLLYAAAAFAWAGCTTEMPETLREGEVSAVIKQQSISLADAIAQKLVTASPMSAHSTREAMAIQLNPQVRSQPWIRIEPGWQAVSPEFPKITYVTGETVYARIPKRKRYEVMVRHVRVHHTRASGLPGQCKLQRLDDERIVAFLQSVGNSEPQPEWKLLQVAVWALADDIGFSIVRPPTQGEYHVFRGNHQFATPGQVQEVMNLLGSTGHQRLDFALWREMVSELDAFVLAYESDWDRNPTKAFRPFRSICNYYPLEVAADVIFSAFDRHDGLKGRPYRMTAVEALRGHGDQRARDLLRRRAAYESDPRILDLLNKPIAAATPPK